MKKITRQVKYEDDLELGFGAEISEKLGCENLDRCIQCGTCSGVCPMSVYMDLTPRRMINMTRAGLKDDLLDSYSIWLCSSCYACTVQCPREIKITDIIYALKQKAIQEGRHPKRFPIPVLATEFHRMVRNHGRINEGLLAAKMFAKTDPRKLISNAKLGLALMKRGRFVLGHENIKGREELRKILDAVDGEQEATR
ncbi:4Fe-4S dicluster domain-containing protein [bacterium]|nr:4Fe-4S dicluster domain-containing protein [bacterium]